MSQVEIVQIEWFQENGKMGMVEKSGSSEVLDVDLVLLAMGFVHPIHEGIADELGLEYDNRGNIKVKTGYQTSVPKIFATGDATIGASLVVRAINYGRLTAKAIDAYLKQ